MSRLACTSVFIFWSVLPLVRIQAQDHSDENLRVDDVPAAFAALPPQARAVKFLRGTTGFPDGGHFQSIQSAFDAEANKQMCFVTRDSNTVALFITIQFPAGLTSFGTIEHLQVLPSDGRQPPLRHPGGAQLVGDYLVIGVEDNQARLRSQVQFWDVSQPTFPVQRTPLTIIRESGTPEDKTAGAVGIVKRDADHLLVVANWGCRVLDFYLSNGFPLGDDLCRFELSVRWSPGAADKQDWKPDQEWGNYQNTTLVADRAGRVFLFAGENDVNDQDFIDLYLIDLAEHPSRIVKKLGSKQMTLTGGARLSAAGGIFVKSRRELVSYSTEDGVREKMTLNVSP